MPEFSTFHLQGLDEQAELKNHTFSEAEVAGMRMAKRQGCTISLYVRESGEFRAIGHVTTGGFQPAEPSYVQ